MMRRRHPLLCWLGMFWFLRHFMRHARHGGCGGPFYGHHGHFGHHGHRRHYDYL